MPELHIPQCSDEGGVSAVCDVRANVPGDQLTGSTGSGLACDDSVVQHTGDCTTDCAEGCAVVLAPIHKTVVDTTDDGTVQRDTEMTQVSSECKAVGPELSPLQYSDIQVDGIDDRVIIALRDSGAEVCLIKQDLLTDLNPPVCGKIWIKGIIGEPVEASLVMLNIKSSPPSGYDNIAPSLPVMFASCDLSTSVDMILCASVVSQLDELSAYCVPKTDNSIAVGVDNEPVISVDAVTLRSGRVLDQPHMLDVQCTHTPDQ